MTSTKLMFLGILIMLLGLALDSATVRVATYRSISLDAAGNLAYIGTAVFVIGFVVGVIGFFRR